MIVSFSDTLAQYTVRYVHYLGLVSPEGRVDIAQNHDVKSGFFFDLTSEGFVGVFVRLDVSARVKPHAELFMEQKAYFIIAKN